MNPKVRIKPPRDINGIECPDIYLLSSLRNLSTLGPKIIAPMASCKMLKCYYPSIFKKTFYGTSIYPTLIPIRACTPPTTCTIPLPAKS